MFHKQYSDSLIRYKNLWQADRQTDKWTNNTTKTKLLSSACNRKKQTSGQSWTMSNHKQLGILTSHKFFKIKLCRIDDWTCEMKGTTYLITDLSTVSICYIYFRDLQKCFRISDIVCWPIASSFNGRESGKIFPENAIKESNELTALQMASVYVR